MRIIRNSRNKEISKIKRKKEEKREETGRFHLSLNLYS